MAADKYAFSAIKKGKDQDLLNGQKTAQEAPAKPKEKKAPAEAPKKKKGRPSDPKGTTVSLSLQTIDRIENASPVVVNGSGRRKNIKFVNLPVPQEVYDRIKKGGNISASLVALMVFGLESLDKENKTLWASYTKGIGDTE